MSTALSGMIGDWMPPDMRWGIEHWQFYLVVLAIIVGLFIVGFVLSWDYDRRHPK